MNIKSRLTGANDVTVAIFQGNGNAICISIYLF